MKRGGYILLVEVLARSLSWNKDIWSLYAGRGVGSRHFVARSQGGLVTAMSVVVPSFLDAEELLYGEI